MSEENLDNIYKQKTNISQIVKYLQECRPDLKDKLLETQVDMIKEMADINNIKIVVSCGRGFGKTMMAAIVALWFADVYSTREKKELTIVLVSSQKALYYNLGVFFRYKPELKSRLKIKGLGPKEIPDEGFQFIDNHSRIIPCMATVHSTESNRADILIFDEAQDIDEAVFNKAVGCKIVDNIKGGKTIIIGTPYTEAKGKSGKINWFIELVKNPKTYLKEPYKLIQYNSEVPWTDHKSWKKMWNKEHYNAECLGIPTPDKEKGWFVASKVKECGIDIEPCRMGDSKSYIEAGLDCAYGNTVLTIIERVTEARNNLLEVVWWKDKSIEEIAEKIAFYINKWKPKIVKIDSKAGMFVPKYEDYIRKYTNCNLVSVDASVKVKGKDYDGKEVEISLKRDILGYLRRVINEHHLVIPLRLEYAYELIDQLLKYDIRRGRNDDLVDSLALACYKLPIKESKVSVVGTWNKNINNANKKGFYIKMRKDEGDWSHR